MNNKKYLYLLLAFFIPFISLFLLFFAKGIFLGSKIIFISDLQEQYAPLHAYLMDVFRGTESIFYSFSKGLGGNMMSTVGYYLSSPLNFLLLFFNELNLYNGITLLIAIKLSLSSLFMYLFLKHHIKNNSFLLVSFSIIYALSGYNVAYFINVMWLDVVMLSPLVLLGLDRLIKGQSSWLYGITLFLAILSQYYIAYMLCIFIVIYFIYRIIVNYNLLKDMNKIFPIIIRFSIITILAASLTSFLSIPNVIDLFDNSNRSVGTAPLGLLSNNFDILGILSRFFIGGHDYSNILSISTPALYVTLIVPILVYMFFANKNISIKEKVITGLIAFILLISIMFGSLNVAWHTFSEPNSFNYRFLFLFSLFFIYIAVRSFFSKGKIKKEHYFIILILFMLVGLIGILKPYPYIQTMDIYISLTLVAIYLSLLYFYRDNRYSKDSYIIKRVKLVSFLISLLIIGELFFNFFISLNRYEFRYKNEYIGHVKTVGDNIKKHLPSENEFYRMEKTYRLSYLESFLYNYYGTKSFLSTENNLNRVFFNNVGNNPIGSIIYVGYGNTEIVDSLLGVKYIFDVNKTRPSYIEHDSFTFSRYAGFSFGFKEVDIPVNLNPHALSLGYMVDSGVKEFGRRFLESDKLNHHGYQNTLMKTLVNSSEDYFTTHDVEVIGENHYRIKLKTKENFYIKVTFNKKFKDEVASVFLNDKKVVEYGRYRTGMIYVENNFDDSIVDLKIEISDLDIEAYYPEVFSIDFDNFEKGIKNLKEHQLEITYQNKNIIKGVVVVPDNKGTMFTTIPYEKGWKIKANGKEVPYYKAIDAFIAFDLEEGEYELEMKFYPPGLNIGIIISFIGLILMTIYLIFERKITNLINIIYSKYQEIIDYLIVGVITTIVSLLSYVIALKLFHINYVISTSISWVVAVIFAYIFSRILVFKSSVNTIKGIARESYEFLKYRIISLFIDVALMVLLVSLLSVDELTSKVLVQIVIVIINYIFSKYFIFKKIT